MKSYLLLLRCKKLLLSHANDRKQGHNDFIVVKLQLEFFVNEINKLYNVSSLFHFLVFVLKKFFLSYSFFKLFPYIFITKI